MKVIAMNAIRTSTRAMRNGRVASVLRTSLPPRVTFGREARDQGSAAAAATAIARTPIADSATSRKPNVTNSSGPAVTPIAIPSPNTELHRPVPLPSEPGPL